MRQRYRPTAAVRGQLRPYARCRGARGALRDGLGMRLRLWAARQPDYTLTLLEKEKDDDKAFNAAYADIGASGKICGIEVESTWPVRMSRYVPYLLVARDSRVGNVIGIAGFGVSNDGNWLNLGILCSKREGIGRAMMLWVEDWARANEMAGIAFDSRSESIGFYRKLGYVNARAPNCNENPKITELYNQIDKRRRFRSPDDCVENPQCRRFLDFMFRHRPRITLNTTGEPSYYDSGFYMSKCLPKPP